MSQRASPWAVGTEVQHFLVGNDSRKQPFFTLVKEKVDL